MLRNIPLLPLWLTALAVLPLALFLWLTSGLLNRQIHSDIVNDPQTALSQSLGALTGAHHRWLNGWMLNASRFAAKDLLKRTMANPVSMEQNLKPICDEVVANLKCPLFILADKNGDVYYDTPKLAAPAPSPTPSVTPAKAKKTRLKAPPRVSIKNWPGVDQALAGTNLTGILPYPGGLYQAVLVPVTSRDKIQGVLLLGATLDQAYLRELKTIAVNEVALYSEALTLCTVPNPPHLDYKKILDSKGKPGSQAEVEWNNSSYLTDALPLLTLDLKPVGALVVFQPVKRSQTVQGDPRQTLRKWGFNLLGLVVVLSVGLWFWFTLPFKRSLEALKQLKSGDFNVSLPVKQPGELGLLARSIQAMVDGLRDKERISLVLGKVVSPLMAKNILESKDLFALKGERRECTLLHADLRGFNTLSENMTPQNLVEALNQYFTLINDIVFKYEGMMDKFMGDTALAVWGAPFTHEDKEWRAVQAALEIQEGLRDFNISRIKKGHPPFTLSIGIHTGTVVSGNLGSEKRTDYTIIGEPLHVAAKLCAMATPGQTVISEETFLKVKDKVKVNPLNPIAVKGSMEALKTYEVTQIL